MIKDWYQTYQDKVNQAIDEYFEKRYLTIASSTENRFQEAVRYAVESGGKRIRPILAMIMYEEMCGLPSDAIIPYIIGLEFIHAYSLVHDDLPALDNDEFRRGKLALWKKYDETTAILVGDALQAMGIETLSHAENPKLITEITSAIGDMGMIRGQIRDVLTNPASISQKDIIRLHDEKTGRLITASILTGVLLAGIEENKEVIEHLRWFGMLLGRAFQVKDDILDYEGDENLTGKLAGKDMAKGKGIVSLIGIDQSRALLGDLEYALLNSATKFQSTKFSDIIEYVMKRQH